MNSVGAPISEYPFTRTGLLGFVGPGGLCFIAGKMDGLMVVGGCIPIFREVRRNPPNSRVNITRSP